jgi:hypothetical protein
MNSNPYNNPYVQTHIPRITEDTDHHPATTTPGPTITQDPTIIQAQDITMIPTNSQCTGPATITMDSKEWDTITERRVRLTAALVWVHYAALAACLIAVYIDTPFYFYD